MNAAALPHFMPHGICYLWNQHLLLLQIASDAGIAFAYFSIPLMLFYFVRKRTDVPFSGAFLMFGAFIVACGVSHVMGIITIWEPVFWLDGGIKAATAVISLATAAMLVPLLPKALELKSPAELERRNAHLVLDLATRARALSESEHRNTAIADALPQLVWTADVDGTIDYYNHRHLEYTGLRLGQALGWGWAPAIHRDDLERCFASWQYSIASGTAYELECRVMRASDQKYRWHLVRAMPIRDTEGKIVKWFGTSTDIDDLKRASESANRYADQVSELNERLERDLIVRKQAEMAQRASDERLRQIEENAPIGLAAVDLDGAYVRVNPALCALLGYTKEELLTKTVDQVVHPDDRAADCRQVCEKRYLKKNGEAIWCLVNESLVRGDDGKPLYAIEQVQDISDRKAAQEDLELARQVALAASDAKSRFLATMSHEIRTPMNGIVGMAELLLLTNLSDEQTEYARVVGDSARSLLRVINDILDYSKMEAGKMELEHVDFDAANQLRSVVSLLGPQFKSKGVSLVTRVDPAVPQALRGDPGRLRQILINLVGNALKFTPPGGSVTVSVENDPNRKGASPVLFTVTDTGIGISADAASRLFKPFSQAGDVSTRAAGGTGLGLSISKQLVEIMKGDIGVSSIPGERTSFWFSIPFERGRKAAPVLAAPAREMGDRRSPVRPRSEKLLLAEDNDINALLALRQFKRLGFAVTVVSNGIAAFDAIQRERFDLVFMDAHMPEIDGFEATRRIRALEVGTGHRVPIVAMTADALPDDREACLAAGMDDYLSKPVTLEDLSAATARWLPADEGSRGWRQGVPLERAAESTADADAR